jgi:hypothetical protein
VVLTTAFVALAGVPARDLGSSAAAVDVVEGPSNAGLAVGAALAQRHVQRRLFLGYEAVFVVASVLTVVAPDVVVNIGLFGASTIGPLVGGLVAQPGSGGS